ncbi:putative ELMO CED 12 family [Trypanosoma vivax]|uniref:ELMO domain-containing protein n=1 Tax=Trypanosoma vivax (strain Y486) TaxID=1055687 RepID=G0U6N5_TRYVY|nr:hypothetical protein TRVL_01928 [Trypanosoma vivax]KAH8612027.1 putative ELMO CED 12 family [Trypanosoma vivax]CCC51539.1 conserved hypothetical protein [Trypanosoma vivax Y486]
MTTEHAPIKFSASPEPSVIASPIVLKYSKPENGSGSLSSFPERQQQRPQAIGPKAVTSHLENDSADLRQFSAREEGEARGLTPYEEEAAGQGTSLVSQSKRVKSAVLSVDWDQVNLEAERRLRATASMSFIESGDRSCSISFLDAVRALKSDTSAWEPYALSLKLRRRERCACIRGFFGSLFSALTNYVKGLSSGSCTSGVGDDKSKRMMQRDVNFSTTLPSVPFDHSNIVHRRLLITIHDVLLDHAGARSGTATAQWEKLGFQGNDPATDLRSTGVFGLIQLVFLLEYYKELALRLWETCTRREENSDNVFEELPFVLVAFNFSAIVLDELRDGMSHAEIVRQSRAMYEGEHSHSYANISVESSPNNEEVLRREFPFLVATCEYYVGCLFQFLELWMGLKKQRGGRPPMIGDFGVVKAKLCASLRRKGVQKVFQDCDNARHLPASLSSTKQWLNGAHHTDECLGTPSSCAKRGKLDYGANLY